MKLAYVLSLLILTAGGNASADSVVDPISSADTAPITCAIQTYNGRYLTAVGGGGRVTDVIHSDARWLRAWEKFTFVNSGDGESFVRYGVRTHTGHYLTVMGGGGRIHDVIHSNATRILDWEKITPISLGYGWYALRTINGNYLTAVGGGGRITDVLHSDARFIGNWEKFKLTCGIR